MSDLNLSEIITRTCVDLKSRFAAISHTHDASDIESLVQSGSTNDRGGEIAVTGPLMRTEAQGWAEQDTTTGKNLLNESKVFTKSSGDGTASGKPKTGINITGVCTARYDGSLSVEVGQTYTISFDVIGSGTGTISIDVGDQTPSGVGVGTFGSKNVSTAKTRVSWTFTYGTATSYKHFDINTYSDIDYEISNIQLELGSTATSYEPYTGGAPSPSPDYPQEIRVARGRNLLDESLVVRGIYNTSTGVAGYTSTAYYITPKISVTPGDILTFSYETNDTNEASVDVLYWTSDGTFIGRTDNVNNVKTITSTVPFNAAFIGITFGQVRAGYTYKAQLELGSTPTPYVPYGYVGLEVQGKNLLDPHIFDNATRNNCTYDIVDGQMVLYASGTDACVGLVGDTYSSSHSLAVPCLPNTTYTLKLGNPIFTKNYVQVFNSNGSRIQYSGQVGQVHTFTTDANASFVTFRVGYQNSVSGTTYKTTIQFELGSTATAYKPYFHTTTPIPLPDKGFAGSLPDGTSDKLTIDSAGKCEWMLPTAQVVFDGSSDEPWSIGADGRRVVISGINPPSSTIADSRITSAICDHYIAKTMNDTYSDAAGYYKGACFSASGEQMFFSDGQGVAMETASWKTWLTTHPVTVLYPLATPVTEDCGYIDLPDIPSDAYVSIPELDALNVAYSLDNSSYTGLEELYQRIQNLDIAEVEDAVAELATEVAIQKTHDQFYLGYHLDGQTLYPSIFRRSDV